MRGDRGDEQGQERSVAKVLGEMRLFQGWENTSQVRGSGGNTWTRHGPTHILRSSPFPGFCCDTWTLGLNRQVRDARERMVSSSGHPGAAGSWRTNALPPCPSVERCLPEVPMGVEARLPTVVSCRLTRPESASSHPSSPCPTPRYVLPGITFQIHSLSSIPCHRVFL